MMTVAVTGGVACGKSLVCDLLLERMPRGKVERFDSDAVVADRLREEPVQDRIRALPGGEELFAGGVLDRGEMRRRAFENSSFREKLEDLLHPLVLDEAVAVRDATQAELLLMEVPLLYEVAFPLPRDFDLVVAASEATRRERLATRRGIEVELAERMMQAQLPMEEKITRGDIVVWNDAGRSILESQVDHLASRCAPLFSRNDR